MGGSPCFGGLAGECQRIKISFDCGLVTIMSRHLNLLLGASLSDIGLETAKISRFFLRSHVRACGNCANTLFLRGGNFLFLEKKIFFRPGFENID